MKWKGTDLMKSTTKPHPSLFPPAVNQSLHKVHERKPLENQGCGKKLVLGLTHARREPRSALDNLFTKQPI